MSGRTTAEPIRVEAQHPSALLGIDPYEFCLACDAAVQATLAERVTAFVERYAADAAQDHAGEGQR